MNGIQGRRDGGFGPTGFTSIRWFRVVGWVLICALCFLVGLVGFGPMRPALAAEVASLAVVESIWLKTTRVTRTLFDFTYDAVVRNSGIQDLERVRGRLVSLSPRTTVIDGEVLFGRVAAGISVRGSDPYTIRQDRTVPFNPNDLVWSFDYNHAPVADAGPDQHVDLDSTVILDGAHSTDQDGDALHYVWTLLERPEQSMATLLDPVHPGDGTTDTPHPQFVVDWPGTYRVRLVVNDGQLESAADLVIVGTNNARPSADAGDPRTVRVFDRVTLDGSRSRDPEGMELSYRWSLPEKPADSRAVLHDAATARPWFEADLFGDYVARLIVSDGELESLPATVVLTTENSPPIADAGSDRSVTLGDTVSLDGSLSRDPDGDPLTYAWSVLHGPDGSMAGILPHTEPQPVFVPDRVGDYVIQLLVKDRHDASATATFTLAVLPKPNQPPVILSSPVTAATVGISYSYQVEASDPDAGDGLTYALTQAPAGMGIDPASGLIQWTPDEGQVGAQPVTVRVEDGRGGGVEQGFEVTVAAAPLPDTVPVPDLLRRTRGAAEIAIEQGKLRLGTLVFEHNDSLAEGQVIRQSPAAGSRVAIGAAVDMTVSLGVVTGLPPSAEIVAPRLDTTVATTIYAATEFLYSGDNPIQTLPNGQPLPEGTIEAKRVAVIRGKVLDRGDNPLPGVIITVKDQPELGQTLSRADGLFDLAVNGGGYLILDYRKESYLPAQRQIQVGWQDYATVDSVVLVQLDPQVTEIDLNAAADPQVARGSVVEDDDGPRQVSLFFPAGTRAEMVMPDGSAQPLPSAHVRVTEYTVGANGPLAMPAQLPPTTAYTWAAEYSVDEAVAAGARQVRFSQPVVAYLDNFLGFDIGIAVPSGVYDRTEGQWIGSESGKVIKILSIVNGLAELDTDGDGGADNGAALAITDAERLKLAELYPVGKSLWRVRHTHFSPCDYNWPPYLLYPDDAKDPDHNPPKQTTPIPSCKNTVGISQALGSIIECENQILGERIPLGGTPFSLSYRSDRTVGDIASRSIRIPLSGQTVPSSLKAIVLGIEIAGQKFVQEFPPIAQQETLWTWNGRDAYGRIKVLPIVQTKILLN